MTSSKTTVCQLSSLVGLAGYHHVLWPPKQPWCWTHLLIMLFAVLAGEKGKVPDNEGSVTAEAVVSQYLTCCAAINGNCFLHATTGLLRMQQGWQGCMT